MGTYAARTEVTSQKSRQEIETILERYGATSFAYASQQLQSMIGFEYESRTIRFVLPLPPKDSNLFRLTPTGKVASPQVQESNYEQAIRQKWRALALVIKAKLEAIESGISTFEQEFYPNIVLPGGKTVWEQTHQQVFDVIDNGERPRLLELE